MLIFFISSLVGFIYYRKKENYRKTTGFLIASEFRDRFTVVPGPFHRGKLRI